MQPDLLHYEDTMGLPGAMAHEVQHREIFHVNRIAKRGDSICRTHVQTQLIKGLRIDTYESEVKMEIIINADDFGASKGITDSILECFTASLNSTSIIATGSAFDYAISEFKKISKPNKRIAVHINLLEGRPLCPPQEISHLVDKEGNFCHSFISLLIAYYSGDNEKKRKLSKEIKNEISAQIRKVQINIDGNNGINIDSHQHFHMLPFIFKIIVELEKEFNIKYIRIPRENFIFDFNVICKSPVNLVKILLLNHLSKKCIKLLSNTQIQYPDYFIGVLATGLMNINFIEKSISSIKNKNNMKLEILLHPGQASIEEAYIWKSYPHLLDFYISSNRTLEKNCLLENNPLFAKLEKV